MTIADLAATWRRDAAILRANGATPQAELVERHAAELEAALREHELESLTLNEAATDSGLSYSAIQKMVARGWLENVGKKGSPRVRRRDLPRKGGSPTRGIAEEMLVRRQA